MRRFALLAAVAALSACNQQPSHSRTAGAPDIEAADDAGATPLTPAPSPAPNPAAPPAAETKVQPDFQRPLRLTGTEPFWGVQIGDKITLQRPDHADVVVTNAGPTINGDVAQWNSPQLTIRLEKGECSDGMSDNRYPYRASVRVGGETLKGCAAPTDAWPKPGGA